MIRADSVAVIVLNYRRATDTLACLASLVRLEHPPGTIRVIDNGSQDGSAERIRAVHPEIKVTVNATNLGFGSGHNRILAELLDAGYDWLWLINNDAECRPDTLDAMLTAATDPATGAVGAIIRDPEPPHAIQVAGGGHIGWWRGNSRQWQPSDASHRPGRELDYITGACMLLNARALLQTGLFDERFFMYWEDADLCLRLRSAGWKLAVSTEAGILHRLSSSTGPASAEKDALINASAVRFFRKHGPLGGWPAIVIGTAGRVFKRLATGRVNAAAAVLRGTLEGLRKPVATSGSPD